MTIKWRRTFVAGQIVIATAALTWFLTSREVTSAQAQVPTTTTTTLPLHFQCFETMPRSFAAQSVSLVDQFGSMSATVEDPQRICNPANKNGEDPTAPMNPNHLTAYRLSPNGAQFPMVRNVEVVNQFGSTFVDVIRPARLLVPAAKSLTGPPAKLPNPGVDHFTCYYTRHTSGTPALPKLRGITVQDEFGTKTIELTAPLTLCAPTNKNGENPGAESHPGHLLCYRVRARDNFSKLGPIFSNDQFGPLTLQVIHRDELCVPSTKVLAVSTSTTTSTTTTTKPTTSTTTTTTPTTTHTSTSTTTTSTTTQTTTSTLGSPIGAFLD